MSKWVFHDGGSTFGSTTYSHMKDACLCSDDSRRAAAVTGNGIVIVHGASGRERSLKMTCGPTERVVMLCSMWCILVCSARIRLVFIGPVRGQVVVWASDVRVQATTRVTRASTALWVVTTGVCGILLLEGIGVHGVSATARMYSTGSTGLTACAAFRSHQPCGVAMSASGQLFSFRLSDERLDTVDVATFNGAGLSTGTWVGEVCHDVECICVVHADSRHASVIHREVCLAWGDTTKVRLFQATLPPGGCFKVVAASETSITVLDERSGGAHVCTNSPVAIDA